MATMQDAAKDFLSGKRIAVVGVSRNQKNAANLIYRKLRTEGYKVFAVNPNATSVEGDICYPNLKNIPEKPDGVVIVTKPEVTSNVVKECKELGIFNVWMHRGIDSKGTSVSEEAVLYCRNNNITVLAGGCPMMYCSHADMGHRIMRFLMAISRSLPKEV
jgi:uncharacterized protein